MFSLKTNKSFCLTEKKSKFFVFGFFIKDEAEAKEKIKKLKKTYYDADHICYCYILGTNQENYYYADGGEPSKTAGFSIYKSMLKNKVSYTIIVVIRYFGGIKLGVSNLKDAFYNSTESFINNNVLAEIHTKILLEITDVSFSDFNKINSIYNVLEKVFLDDCINCKILISENDLSKFNMYKSKILDANFLVIE